MSGPTHRNATIERLTQQLARLEQSNRSTQGEEARHSNQNLAQNQKASSLEEREGALEIGLRQHSTKLHSTGILALDALLPEHGIRDGTLVEWLRGGAGGGAGSGTATLAFTAASHAVQPGTGQPGTGQPGTGQPDTGQSDGVCIVIDERRVFYPPAVHWLGGDLDRMIVVHPPNTRETLWAFEQSLRCSGVAVVVGWIDRITPRDFRRLQLAAEAGGGMGFLLRPAKCQAEPSWAAARLLVEPLPAVGASRNDRRLRVALLHCRGRLNRGAVELEIDDATGDVHLASQLARSADSLRATGA